MREFLTTSGIEQSCFTVQGSGFRFRGIGFRVQSFERRGTAPDICTLRVPGFGVRNSLHLTSPDPVNTEHLSWWLCSVLTV